MTIEVVDEDDDVEDVEDKDFEVEELCVVVVAVLSCDFELSSLFDILVFVLSLSTIFSC